MYLAKAYVKQYVPGVHTPDNSHLAEQVIDQYQHVLDSNSNRMARIDSAKGIAELYLHENKFEDSKKFYQMESDLDPRGSRALLCHRRHRFRRVHPTERGRGRQAGPQAGRASESEEPRPEEGL